MSDSNWWADNGRSGFVLGEPNMSEPIPSVKYPGSECALNRYPSGNVWLFMRVCGEKLWSPHAPATEGQIAAFRERGLIRSSGCTGNFLSADAPDFAG